MKRGLVNLIGTSIISLSSLISTANGNLVINEFVTNPKQDYNHNGIISDGSDEFIELYNSGNKPINLDNYKLLLEDETPTEQVLSGTINPKNYFLILNPAGRQNNDGKISLLNSLGDILDSVQYGNWNSGTNNAPSGKSNSYLDDSISRISNTGINSIDFIKTQATPGYTNVPEPLVLSILGFGFLGLKNSIKFDSIL